MCNYLVLINIDITLHGNKMKKKTGIYTFDGKLQAHLFVIQCVYK